MLDFETLFYKKILKNLDSKINYFTISITINNKYNEHSIEKPKINVNINKRKHSFIILLSNLSSSVFLFIYF